MAKVESNDLQALIDGSAEESEAALDPTVSSARRSALSVNHLPVICLVWIIALIFAVQSVVNPVIPTAGSSTTGVQTRLGVAMYHVAHRVETYRRITGDFPDFLDEDFGGYDIGWGTSGLVEYTRDGDSYVLRGKLGELELEYRHGEDPERLLTASLNAQVVTR